MLSIWSQPDTACVPRAGNPPAAALFFTAMAGRLRSTSRPGRRPASRSSSAAGRDRARRAGPPPRGCPQRRGRSPCRPRSDRLGIRPTERRAAEIHGAAQGQVRATGHVTAGIERPGDHVGIADQVHRATRIGVAGLGVEEDEHPQAVRLGMAGNAATGRTDRVVVASGLRGRHGQLGRHPVGRAKDRRLGTGDRRAGKALASTTLAVSHEPALTVPANTARVVAAMKVARRTRIG